MHFLFNRLAWMFLEIPVFSRYLQSNISESQLQEIDSTNLLNLTFLTWTLATFPKLYLPHILCPKLKHESSPKMNDPLLFPGPSTKCQLLPSSLDCPFWASPEKYHILTWNESSFKNVKILYSFEMYLLKSFWVSDHAFYSDSIWVKIICKELFTV